MAVQRGKRSVLPCVLSRDVHAQNLEKKILEILSTTDGKKKLEIDCKNLENSEICTDEKSRDLRFSRNVNLEKIYLYDGPNEIRRDRGSRAGGAITPRSFKRQTLLRCSTNVGWKDCCMRGVRIQNLRFVCEYPPATACRGSFP